MGRNLKLLRGMKCSCGCGITMIPKNYWKYPSYNIPDRLPGHHDSKGIPKTEDCKRRLSVALQNYYKKNPTKVVGLRNVGKVPWNKGLTKKTHPSLKRQSENRKGIVISDLTRRRIRKSLFANHSKEQLSLNGMKGRRKIGSSSINKSEKRALKVLENLCPGLWKYNGDGKILKLGLLKPDFICVKHKLVLEVAGEKWHTSTYPQKRAAQLRKYGYKCTTIWSDKITKKLIRSRLRNLGLAV